jgi:NADPH-dependent 7-cyano-7-deazaguanine reductase QueF
MTSPELPDTVLDTDGAGSRPSVTTAIQHMCPHRAEVDNGTITVSWFVKNWTIELHSLKAYLGGWAHKTLSHEALVAQIGRDLSRLNVYDVTVTSSWETAGMAVAVSWPRNA